MSEVIDSLLSKNKLAYKLYKMTQNDLEGCLNRLKKLGELELYVELKVIKNKIDEKTSQAKNDWEQENELEEAKNNLIKIKNMNGNNKGV